MDAPLAAILLARRHRRRSAPGAKDFGWAMAEHLERLEHGNGD